MAMAQQHLDGLERPAISNSNKVEQSFYSTDMPSASSLDHYIQLLQPAIDRSVNTQRPDFIGHMTSALPSYMPVMAKLMAGLNQNLVKLETSGSFTDLERQVLAVLHRLFYRQGQSRVDDFYTRYSQQADTALGVFCSGGTIANTLALWLARNRFLAQYNVAEEGLVGAMLKSGYRGFAVLVSERGHYSLSKAADVLGIGRKQLVAIAVDNNHRMDLQALEQKVQQLQQQNIKVIALVGVAGATETGSIDPLTEMAAVAKQLQCHFHVDGAWGGAAIFSSEHGAKLAGIELADSITLDAHKQLYVPMGAGMVLFKDPAAVNHIKHHASYIIRSDSRDLGAFTLEGSRPAMSLLVHAGLHLIGAKGYAALVDHSMALASSFAEMIKQAEDFELLVEPQLNILSYRYLPEWARHVECLSSPQNQRLNQLTVAIQVRQAELGASFVSRTQLRLPQYQNQEINVLRVVLANPHTDAKVLAEVLEQQRGIAKSLAT